MLKLFVLVKNRKRTWNHTNGGQAVGYARVKKKETLLLGCVRLLRKIEKFTLLLKWRISKM